MAHFMVSTLGSRKRNLPRQYNADKPAADLQHISYIIPSKDVTCAICHYEPTLQADVSNFHVTPSDAFIN